MSVNGNVGIKFGQGDATYQAVGGAVALLKLVNVFYDIMDTLPEAKNIRSMHPQDLTESRKKLAYFLSGWMGGPRLYREHYGEINIPRVHMHLSIGDEEKAAWLLCMEKALDQLGYDAALKRYLLEQLAVPAERIRQTSRD